MLTTRLSKYSNIDDLLAHFYTIVNDLKESYEIQLRSHTEQIQYLQRENEQLRGQSHAVFNIDYIPPQESLTIEQLRLDLQRAQGQISALQRTVDEKQSECDDMKSKYDLQLLINKNSSTEPCDSNRIHQYEFKLQQIKDQLQQFEQCHYESEEQIRLLKDIFTRHDVEPMKTINQSLTVKQADLIQQTDIIENILHKQEEKILEKLLQFVDQSSNVKKSTKRKR